MLRCPVERGGETRAAVELAAVAALLVPLSGCVHQVHVQVAAVGVLLEPVAQPRPFAQERLVGNLDVLVGLC